MKKSKYNVSSDYIWFVLLYKIICVYNAISTYDSDRDRKYFLESNFLLNTNIKMVKCRINPQFKKIEKRKGIQVLKTGSKCKKDFWQDKNSYFIYFHWFYLPSSTSITSTLTFHMIWKFHSNRVTILKKSHTYTHKQVIVICNYYREIFFSMTWSKII